MVTFWTIFKSITFQVKITAANIWVTLRKFGLRFISTSGHTGRNRIVKHLVKNS